MHLSPRLLAITLGTMTLLATSRDATAQVRPFFNGGATSFDPEVSVVYTGVLNDVQATVSADRKYVTLNMQPQNSRLLALREFSFQNGVNPIGQVGVGPANPAGPAQAQNVLTREGMARIDRRQAVP